jgi:hypothetical protein
MFQLDHLPIVHSRNTESTFCTRPRAKKRANELAHWLAENACERSKNFDSRESRLANSRRAKRRVLEACSEFARDGWINDVQNKIDRPGPRPGSLISREIPFGFDEKNGICFTRIPTFLGPLANSSLDSRHDDRSGDRSIPESDRNSESSSVVLLCDARRKDPAFLLASVEDAAVFSRSFLPLNRRSP